MNAENNEDRGLRISVRSEKDAAVVTLFGSAGMEEADDLRNQLLEVADQKPRVLVVDMTHLDFICSIGLSGMVASCLRCWRHQGVVRLVRPRPAIHNILVKTKLTALFEIFGSLQEAIADSA